MGQKQNDLRTIINAIYENKKHEKPTSAEILGSKYSEDVFEVYSSLQGQLNEPPTKFGSWDISTNNFIIELDEERHFNRYRFTTLNSSFYKTQQFFSIKSYKDYCNEKEQSCLKAAAWGGNWKNNSTEKQFCASNLNGMLDGNGSSRWKQRAYYDFLKDISSKIMNVPVIRISIYDSYKGFSVEQMLKKSKSAMISEFIDLKIIESMSLVKNDEELPKHVLDGIRRGQEDIAAGRIITLELFKKQFS